MLSFPENSSRRDRFFPLDMTARLIGYFLFFSGTKTDKEVWTEETTGCYTTCEYQTTKTRDHTVLIPDEAAFVRKVEQWHAERGITSSLSEITACTSYLQIIGMGEKALPLILAQLRREGDDPDHWFTALEAITGEDPVPEDAYGDTVKMAEVWLLWAEGRNVW